MPNYTGPNLDKVYASHRQGRARQKSVSELIDSCTFWHNLYHQGCEGQSTKHVLQNHPDPEVFRHCFPESWESVPPQTPVERRAVGSAGWGEGVGGV